MASRIVQLRKKLNDLLDQFYDNNDEREELRPEIRKYAQEYFDTMGTRFLYDHRRRRETDS